MMSASDKLAVAATACLVTGTILLACYCGVNSNSNNSKTYDSGCTTRTTTSRTAYFFPTGSSVHISAGVPIFSTSNYRAEPKPYVQQPMNTVRQFDGANAMGGISMPPRNVPHMNH